MFEEYGVEAVIGSMAMCFAVDVVVFCRIFIFEIAVLGEMGTSAYVADVCDFFAIGCYVPGIDSMAFEAMMWLCYEFLRDASFFTNAAPSVT